jgi:hypothetical protein
MRFFYFLLVVGFFLANGGTSQLLYAQSRTKTNPPAINPPASAARKTAEQITARELREYLQFIASDEMEGRDTPSRGLDLTAKFLAMQLALWGVKPAGDGGTYFQKFALRRTKIAPARTFAEFDGKIFSHGVDLLAAPQIAGETEAAPLVYVGHGWQVKAKNIDAYKGIDVKDKIAVIAGGGFPPREVGGSFPLPGKQGEDWNHPFAYAAKHGAKGVILLPTFRSLAGWEREFRNQTTRGTLAVENLPSAAGKEFYAVYYSPMVATFGFRMDDGYRLPTVSISARMANELFRGEKQEAAVLLQRAATGAMGEAFDFNAAKRLKLSVGLNTKIETTQNVVGVLEGSDPVLKNEYVAVGAHYDHVGVADEASGDGIFNGADDDGSGTVAVLAMARALASTSARPKRSVLFVWHAGEEKGLWGSEYFAEKPTVPLDKIVAQLNIDMIGRSRAEGDTDEKNKDLTLKDEIYVIGSKMMSSDLGALSERVNVNYLKLKFNYKYDAPDDPERFFYRSDHFNYARKGIPIIFYFNGPHRDYHQPSDSVEKIDFEKIESVTRTVLMTALEIANAARRPVVDKPLKLN